MKRTIEEAQFAYNWLIELIEDGVSVLGDKDVGLCSNFDRVMDDEFEDYFELSDFVKYNRWPLWSGDNSFTIPHPTLPPDIAYQVGKVNFWDKRTTYGKSRWAFVQWCADEIKRKYLTGEDS